MLLGGGELDPSVKSISGDEVHCVICGIFVEIAIFLHVGSAVGQTLCVFGWWLFKSECEQYLRR